MNTFQKIKENEILFESYKQKATDAINDCVFPEMPPAGRNSFRVIPTFTQTVFEIVHVVL